jgi:peptidoglycan hydrolase-like protein with peptidoglycan-binding domain
VFVALGAPWMPGTACLERRLAQLGLFSRPPDDLFDWDTRVGVSLFQQSAGLANTSMPDQSTLGRLGIWAGPPAPTCTVNVGLGAPWMPGTACLERRLAQLGLFNKSPDDLFDWDTSVGLSLFQQSAGLPNTARPDKTTLTRLGVWVEPGAAPCTVQRAVTPSQPAGTRCLEARLAQFGLFSKTPDDVYDWDTAVAVSLYQQSVGLPNTGVADSTTAGRLRILINPLPDNSGSGRRIVYSRAQQRLWAVEADGTVVKTHRVSGRTYEPLAGTYYVYSRSEYTYSANDPSVRWRYMVRFTYGFQGGRIGFHEIPNRNGVPLQSSEQLGLPLSGGCVRQTTADALWIWNWAPVGTKVVVL